MTWPIQPICSAICGREGLEALVAALDGPIRSSCTTKALDDEEVREGNVTRGWQAGQQLPLRVIKP